MNNSKIVYDNVLSQEDAHVKDFKPQLRQREGELVKIIETIGRVSQNSDWQLLKAHIFDGVLESIESRFTSEAKKKEVNSPELYRLQGQLAWAKRYANLEDFANILRVELTNIRKQLHG